MTITHTDILIAFIVVVLVSAFLFLRVKGISLGSNLLVDHFGDMVGLFLILLGVTITLVSPLYSSQTATVQIMTTGAGLITAGFVALKLKTVPDSSANGGTVTTDSHVTQVIDPVKVPPASTTTLFPPAAPAAPAQVPPKV